MLKSRKTLWISFFALASLVFIYIASQFSEPREIHLSQTQAEKIGHKIWLNEGAGKVENLVVWNAGEDFPSLGIGHFIWYPQGVEKRFEESFPGLLSYIGTHREIPAFLNETPYPPWQTRAEFLADQNSTYIIALRAFLQETVAEQTSFIVQRLENALPRILKTIKNPFAKMHVRENFYRVATQPNGVYALVDYVNFKGEGINPKERYNGLGWGLAHVLEKMDDKAQDSVKAFSEAADFILTRRVENAPRDETRWLPGWRKRLQTYTKL